MEASRQDILSRLATWRDTGDPGALWPHVRTERRNAAHARIAEVTAAVLNTSVRRPRLEAGGPDDVAAAGIAGFVSGMGALMGYWIEQGVVDADDRISDLFARHLDHGRRRATKLDCLMIPIVQALAEQGITPAVLKGAHTAQDYFPEPGTRPACDIDLLIHPEELPRARAALREANMRESDFHETLSERTHWVAVNGNQKVQSLDLDHVDNPWSIDLHVSLDRRYFRGLRRGFGDLVHKQTVPWRATDNAHRTTRPTAPPPVDLRVLAQPLLTAFLAQHASYHTDTLRLLAIVELAMVIRSDGAMGLLDWDELGDLLTRTRMTRFVYPALVLTERLLPGTLDPDFHRQLERAATTRMVRVVDEIYRSGIRGFRPISVDLRLMWARGPVEWVQNMSDVVWPTINPNSRVNRWQAYRRRMRMLQRGQISVTAGTRDQDTS